ncbi:MAG: hypoxanthine phosphoribosyltransferase [Deltaproteobacteria bacterium RBG_16_54_18]|nr:MAG: hypoxanthine phosphoribosyltransferase [Deltaproteobacteria bacterium RBG_16_54_18]
MTEELKPLFSREDIAETVARLAREISADYADKQLVLVGVLKGAFVFLADLIRDLTIPGEIDFVRLASYGSRKESSGEVVVKKDVEITLAGKDVLIVEDIVDTGLSLKFLMDHLRTHNPSSLRVCALVDKRFRRKIEVTVDYTGFAIDDGFIVGYGIDFNERYRTLPDICVID